MASEAVASTVRLAPTVPSPSRPPAGPPGTAPGELPLWPVLLLFVGFPAFWVLGLGTFAGVLCAVPMAALLWARRDVRLPSGFAFWAFFVAWVLIAAVQLDGPMRLVGYGVRLSNYLGAAALFVYVYNLPAGRRSRDGVLGGLTAFAAFVVVGGWLGVLVPNGYIVTPMSLLLPESVLGNEYVSALVRPAFAEVQQPYGSPTVFGRPSAPFPYTNGWGCNMALLAPVLVATAAYGSFWRKAAVAVVVVGALVPAFATLNRGLYIAIAAAACYAVIRYALRGRLLPLVGLLAAGGMVLGLAGLTGVGASLQERLEYSETNESRLTLYEEAIRGTLASPLLGNGAPRPSQYLDISVGTQGQIWNVMFSYGFPALAAFVLFFAWSAWASRRASGGGDLWLHTSLVIALMTIVYYGYDGPQLLLVMVVAALALRPRAPSPGPAAVGR